MNIEAKHKTSRMGATLAALLVPTLLGAVAFAGPAHRSHHGDGHRAQHVEHRSSVSYHHTQQRSDREDLARQTLRSLRQTQRQLEAQVDTREDRRLSTLVSEARAHIRSANQVLERQGSYEHFLSEANAAEETQSRAERRIARADRELRDALASMERTIIDAQRFNSQDMNGRVQREFEQASASLQAAERAARAGDHRLAAYHRSVGQEHIEEATTRLERRQTRRMEYESLEREFRQTMRDNRQRQDRSRCPHAQAQMRQARHARDAARSAFEAGRYREGVQGMREANQAAQHARMMLS